MKTESLSTKAAISVIACLAVVVAVAYMAYLFHKNYEERVVLQTQQQLLMSAGSIVLGIEGFIGDYSDNLKIISKNPIIREKAYKSILVKKPPTKHCVCRDLYEVHKDHVDVLTLLDAKGIMLRRLPHIEERIGRDYSDKPDVAYVLREHKAHVSKVFYNDSGNPVISISEPEFYNDEFAGMVQWVIPLDTISKRFIEPVKVGSKGYAWMFDNKNLILSHPQKDFIGISVSDATRKMHKERGKYFDESRLEEHIREEHDYLNRVKVEEEGYGIFINCVADENDIVAYKRISAGEATWNLITTLPYSEIAGPIYEHAASTFGLAGVVVLLFGIGGTVLFRTQKRKAELETEAKYLKELAESAEALQKAHDVLEQRVEERTAELARTTGQLDLELTERKRAEEQSRLHQEQLFQAAKMISLGTLVSGVAHEINNPASFLMLNAPILQKVWSRVIPILDEHCRENGEFQVGNLSYTQLRERLPRLLSDIVDGAGRVKSIVSDLKDFARQTPSDLTDMVDVNSVVKAAIGLVSNIIKKSTKHFSVEYGPDLPRFKGNTQRIEQVIVNLLMNACQSLPDNERPIVVSTAYDEASANVVIKVCDRGAGMSVEVLRRIKDPFFTTSRESGGTGLGLAVSDRIIQDHGGVMAFVSSSGQGTTVTVSLPLGPAGDSENNVTK